MIRIPTKGFSYSVSAHNVELNTLCDWIEGCVMFAQSSVSLSDIVDLLMEEHIYVSQDFAKARVGDAFKELQRRTVCLGKLKPYLVGTNLVKRNETWSQVPAFAFCLMLTLQAMYREAFKKKLGANYTDQGMLFEQLTAQAIERLGWKSFYVGWSKQASTDLATKVQSLAAHLGEPCSPGGIIRWSAEKAKDAGLDVVCDLRFADGWPGRPLIFMQCASGEDWVEKKASPNLRVWDKMLDLATTPCRGIAIPFALLGDQFRKHSCSDQMVLFLDRHRISAPRGVTSGKWIDAKLAKELNNWTKLRVKVLPRAQ